MGELTIVQRRCTILIEKRQLAVKNDITSTLKKVAYMRKRNKIMQKFMEKAKENSTEKIRSAFRSWRKFWKIHQHTSCRKCHIKFDTYFWQLHAKSYFQVKIGNTNHEIHQGRLCKDCIKRLPLVEGKQKCPLCKEEIVPAYEINIDIIFPLITFLIYEYRYGGQLANNLPAWINRHFSNFAIIVSGHCFSKINIASDYAASFLFSLTFANYIEVTTHCSIGAILPIQWTINTLMGWKCLFFEGGLSNLIPLLGYPSLASFISQIYNPRQLASDPYLPVPISNWIITLGGHHLLGEFISKFHTYEFGYIGRLAEKIIKSHLNLIVFVIELQLLLNVYEFNTLHFVAGCLLLVFYIYQQVNKS